MEGPRWNLDEVAELWTRNGPTKVILKRLNNSQNMSQEFVNQLYRYYKCLQNGALADYFGMTKDPTSCYMFVMRYYENENLNSYLAESMGNLCWRDVVDILWSISAGLRPSVVNGTPPVFSKLMLQCLNSSPSSRPTASQISECLENWVSDLPSQFGNTNVPFVNLEKLSLQSSLCHEKAIYFSRPLDSFVIQY
ncbi:unnamed protein product [Rhizophagus irregularis]|nr:unnamed protein product [Rhizophagus irregularis]